MTPRSSPKSTQSRVRRPRVYSYLDYRVFLKDWVEFQKTRDPDFSVQRLAEKAGLSSSYLFYVLSGERRLTLKSVLQLMPCLGLRGAEQSYFESLVKLETSSSAQAKALTVSQMSRLSGYQKLNP